MPTRKPQAGPPQKPKRIDRGLDRAHGFIHKRIFAIEEARAREWLQMVYERFGKKPTPKQLKKLATEFPAWQRQTHEQIQSDAKIVRAKQLLEQIKKRERA